MQRKQIKVRKEKEREKKRERKNFAVLHVRELQYSRSGKSVLQHIIWRRKKRKKKRLGSLQQLNKVAYSLLREKSLVQQASLCTKCSRTITGSLPSPALCLGKASGEGCSGQGGGTGDLLPMHSSRPPGRIEPPPAWLSLPQGWAEHERCPQLYRRHWLRSICWIAYHLLLQQSKRRQKKHNCNQHSS